MLSQRMTKSVALIYFKTRQGNTFETDKTELKKAVALFNQTLTAFSNGGTATSATGKTIFVDSLNQPEILTTLDDARKIWLPTFQALNDFFDANSFQQADMQKIIKVLSANNLKLLKLMNDLTNQLERGATRKTYYLKALQTVVVVLILFSFGMATLRLLRRENYYNNLMEKSTDIVVGVDVETGKITFVSSSVHQVLGYEIEYYIGKHAISIFATDSKPVFSEILAGVIKKGILKKDRYEVELIKHDGSKMTADMVLQLSASEDGRSVELSADIRDISERKEAENALSRLAYKDELTGLPNRKLFNSLSKQSISRASRYDLKFAIMFIDLDGFKAVNDEFGHDIGDKLLVCIADKLSATLRASDSVARIGGDEFVILLEDVRGQSEIRMVGEKVIRLLSEIIVIENHKIQIGASIGIARFPRDGATIKKLVKKADKAMYKVKQSGKNNICFS